jgi:hypothetical protein
MPNNPGSRVSPLLCFATTPIIVQTFGEGDLAINYTLQTTGSTYQSLQTSTGAHSILEAAASEA